ncbi:DctP family TRAP transporter solute-binding subunit [Acuticoccus kandeliae]|uniref:TRAP transporter substrate-binding protein n=1 Tax=Acuticoccus kandeliae TaxID=2073160 RepID=UPI001FE69F0B|nr:DctP family TRAP transporter solute-binding subunit [Acuticoccus kandeliae]
MKTTIRTLMASAAIVAIAAGPATTTASAQDITIRLGHNNKPDPYDNPAHACAQVFQNIVQSDSNGTIAVEIYPNDQIGTAAEQVQMVRDGVIEASLSSTGSLAPYYPNIDVLNLPFAFADNAATYEVFDGDFGKALKADMEKVLGDVVVLGFPDTGGFFAVTNSEHEIATLDDFKGIRLRTMTLPSHQAIMNALGAEAYPLAWGEVYSALQTGVIDGQMNPIPIISFSNFNEVQGFMTLTNHLFSPYTFLLNKAVWDGLDDDQKAILRYATQSCVAASRGLSRIIEASERGVTGLAEKGMKVTALSPEDRAKMREVTLPAFEEHINSQLGPDAAELLAIFKADVDKANSSQFMED